MKKGGIRTFFDLCRLKNTRVRIVLSKRIRQTPRLLETSEYSIEFSFFEVTAFLVFFEKFPYSNFCCFLMIIYSLAVMEPRHFVLVITGADMKIIFICRYIRKATMPLIREQLLSEMLPFDNHWKFGCLHTKKRIQCKAHEECIVQFNHCSRLIKFLFR